jgi:hypothetical protein
MDKSTKKYLTIGAIVAGSAISYGLYRKVSKTVKVKAAETAFKTGNSKVTGVNLQEIATQLGMDMGFSYGVLDPRRWTENDDAVRILLLKATKPFIPQLSALYTKTYPGRSLVEDVQKTNDYWPELAYLFKP